MDSFALRGVRQTPQKWLASAGIVFYLLLAACGQAASTPTPDVSDPAWLATAIASGEVRVMTFVSTLYVSYEERIKAAEAILLGKVVEISLTHWNQDSGEYWHTEDVPGPLEIYTITIQSTEMLFDSLGLADPVVLTMIGNSPLERDTDAAIEVGDVAVFFIETRSFGWREGGTKQVLTLVGDAEQGISLVGEGGSLSFLQYEGESVTSDTSLEQLRTTVRAIKQGE